MAAVLANLLSVHRLPIVGDDPLVSGDAQVPTECGGRLGIEEDHHLSLEKTVGFSVGAAGSTQIRVAGTEIGEESVDEIRRGQVGLNIEIVLALDLFEQSLAPRGFLGLGSHERLDESRRGSRFEDVVPAERLYRRSAS